MTLAVWNSPSRKFSPPPRVRETKRSPRQILPKQYLPGVQTPAKLPLSGGTKRSRAFLIKKPRYIQQSPRRKTAAESCRWQLADPVGPYSFASPVCAGFADNTFGYVQYTTLPRNCKRKAAIFIANCSKFLQILHRAGNIPVLRHIQVRIDLHGG